MQRFKKQTFLQILFLLLMAGFVIPAFAANTAAGTKTQAAEPLHYYTVTYFHGSFRCSTCQRIETFSEQAINKNFTNELKNGTMVWRTVNVEEPENRHYNTDYQLHTRSLIISEIRDGKEMRWKNLEKVWNFVRNEAAFDQYVSSEIKAWVGQK